MVEKLKVEDNVSSFQRYHARENIHSSNAMLLLKKIYDYSHDKFYKLLSSCMEIEENQWCPQFVTQHKEKDKDSIPDGLIYQTGFKCLIEAKEKNKDFNEQQLVGHLAYLNRDATNHYLILLAVEFSANDENIVDKLNKIYNDKIKKVRYIELCEIARSLFNEYKDSEMYELIEEFYNYCLGENLIDDSDYKIRIRACGNTLLDNVKYKMYYDTAEHEHKGFKYLGLYNQRTVKYIGKILKIIKTNVVDDKDVEKMTFECVENYSGKNKNVTSEEIVLIKDMIKTSPYKDSLTAYSHKFFIMEDLKETNFLKGSKGGLFTYRMNIDIRKYGLNKDDYLETIADALNNQEWGVRKD